MLRIKSTKLAGQLKWRSIDESYLKKIISFAKNEDLKGVGLATPPHNYGDQSSKINPSLTQIQSELIAREPLVLCGVNLVPLILKSYSKELKFISKKFDGEMLMKDEPIGIIEGPCKMILKAERVVLNFLQHLSGISTLTQIYTSQLNKETPPNKRIKLLDTRKTTPCYRALEKYAFTKGGGFNHRYGLFDRLMLKDNHLLNYKKNSNFNLIDAIKKFKIENPKIPVQIEVDNIKQIPIALDSKVDVILLDNFSKRNLVNALELIDKRVYTEVSGGVKLKDLSFLKTLNLDFISTGAPIHQSMWVDIGLDFL